MQDWNESFSFRRCGTWTLGFNSNVTTEVENHRLSKSKFKILDRVAFQNTRLGLGNTVAVNASFWLDIIDKPDEDLRFSVTKKLIIRNGHQPLSSNFGPSHGSEPNIRLYQSYSNFHERLCQFACRWLNFCIISEPSSHCIHWTWHRRLVQASQGAHTRRLRFRALTW